EEGHEGEAEGQGRHQRVDPEARSPGRGRVGRRPAEIGEGGGDGDAVAHEPPRKKIQKESLAQGEEFVDHHCTSESSREKPSTEYAYESLFVTGRPMAHLARTGTALDWSDRMDCRRNPQRGSAKNLERPSRSGLGENSLSSSGDRSMTATRSCLCSD